MKNIIAFLTASITALLMISFSMGVTSAYFKDIASSKEADVSAGYLDISVEVGEQDKPYGIPSDKLRVPITVKNNGSTDMMYELSLNIDADMDLFEQDGIVLYLMIDSEGEKKVEELRPYVYEGEVESFGTNEYVLEFTFRGATLIDGNKYQNINITVEPVVAAYQKGCTPQTGGDEG